MNIDMQIASGQKNIFTPGFTYNPNEIVVLCNEQPVEFDITPQGNIKLANIPPKGTPIFFVESADFHKIVSQVLIMGLNAFQKSTAREVVEKINAIDALYIAAVSASEELKTTSKQVSSLIEDAQKVNIKAKQNHKESLNMIKFSEDAARTLNDTVTRTEQRIKASIASVQENINAIELKLENIMLEVNQTLKQIRQENLNADRLQDANNKLSSELRSMHAQVIEVKKDIDAIWDKPLTATLTLPR
jgi:hypothetical protein